MWSGAAWLASTISLCETVRGVYQEYALYGALVCDNLRKDDEESPMTKKKRKRQKRSQPKQARRESRRRRARPSTRAAFPFRGPASHRLAGIPDERTLMAGLMEIETLGDEPEFADFTLGEHTFDIIGEMMADSDEDIQRLEAAGEEEEIDRLMSEASMSALAKAVTPAVKADIRRRLDQLSRRLQQEGQSERASSMATLSQMLDFPAFPWVMFGPVRQAFDDAVREFTGTLMINMAVAEAAGVPFAELAPGQAAKLLEDPIVQQRFEALCEQDEMLREAMDSQFDQAYDEFMEDLFNGDLTLGLFTAEELMLSSALIYRQRQLTESEPEPSDEEASASGTVQAVQQALQTLNTPERRQRWRARIAQLEADGEKLSGPMQAALLLFREALTEPIEDDALMPLLIAAYVGEIGLQEKRAEADPALSEELEETFTRILERLERDEPPLV